MKLKRIIFKSLTYRLTNTLITAIIILLFTQNYTLAIGIGCIDFICKIFSYIIHECIWEHKRMNKRNTKKTKKKENKKHPYKKGGKNRIK